MSDSSPRHEPQRDSPSDEDVEKAEVVPLVIEDVPEQAPFMPRQLLLWTTINLLATIGIVSLSFPSSLLVTVTLAVGLGRNLTLTWPGVNKRSLPTRTSLMTRPFATPNPPLPPFTFSSVPPCSMSPRCPASPCSHVDELR